MSGHPHALSKRSRILLLTAIVVTGTVLSLLGYWILTTKERGLVRAQLDADAEQRGRAIERRLRSDIATVYQLSPFVGERGPGTRDDFRRLADGILGSNQDLGSLLWIPRVKPDQRADHEAAARAQGYAGYRIKPWTPADGQRGGDDRRPADSLPIYFAEPQRRNVGKRGLDLATAPVVAQQLAQAAQAGQGAQTGRLAVTNPIPWTDDDRQYTAILVFRPMYDDAAPSDSGVARREKLVGFLAAVIRVDALLEGALYVFLPEIDVWMFDDAGPNGRELVCAFDAEAGSTLFVLPETNSAQNHIEPAPRTALDIPGRSWSLEFRPTRSYFARHTGPLPLVVLSFGMLLTVILTTYANTLMGRTARVEQIVMDRTTELARERFLLDTLLGHSPDYIYFKDAQSRFIRISRALAGYFGLNEPGEAVGRTDFDFFDAERSRQYRADEQEVMQTGQPAINKEEEQPWPDGRVTWMSTTKVPLFDTDGAVIGTFGISRDVTVQKRAGEEVRRARDAAETANRAKSDFLANMSHEIRTPMNAVIGMTELVLDTELTPSQRDYLTMVQASADSLLALLNEVLDFSKIEAGKLELHPAPFDLEEELCKALKSLSLKAHAKGLELACRIRPDTPLRLIGDAARLRQIVVNLLSNAIKFTERGEVLLDVESRPAAFDLECDDSSPLSFPVDGAREVQEKAATSRRTPEGEDDAVLHFAVADTGIGIPGDKLGKIFGAFEQVDTSTTRKFGGTGLGLAICSRLVELMGGAIWAESEVGRGSTFHFSAHLRLPRNGAAAEPSGVPPGVRDTRILVVDDNATNRRILEETLANWGMKTVSVADGCAAIRVLREAHCCGNPFELVLTDANMPEMDGFELARQVKLDAELGSTVIMMLTSGDRPGDIARCEQLGVAAYLLKPIHQSELLESILMALGAASSQKGAAQDVVAEELPPLRPLRILLAEDSLVNQKLAVGLLAKHGHTVIVANDGQEALAALATHEVDLVLMDVQMPGMDGFEATAAIRAKEKRSRKHVPIIAMTAHAMKGDRERCLEAGMDDYVAKPISAKHLLATISAVLTASSGVR